MVRSVCLLLFYTLPALAVDIGNEQADLAAKFYEEAWQINCAALLREIKNGADTTDSALQQKVYQCGLIYNQRDTARYRPCPDFMQLYQTLKKGAPAMLPECATQP
jgi:hypothetical protein